MSGQIHCQLEGAVARVTLVHVGKVNAMTRSMWRELVKVFRDLSVLKPLRAVVIQGQGGDFCAGGDISEYPSFRFAPDTLRAFHEEDVWGGLSAVLACPVPVIAQIEGICMGAGLEIACCCDIRVADDHARFGAPIAKLGFPMAPREAQLVASRLGVGVASEMLLEASVVSATRLSAIGFLSAVTTRAELASEVAGRLERLVALAPAAARANKSMLRALASGCADVDALVVAAYDYADSPEHREGIAAFRDKRSPRY